MYAEPISAADVYRYQTLPENPTEEEIKWKREYIAREKWEEDRSEPDDLFGCEDLEDLP